MKHLMRIKDSNNGFIVPSHFLNISKENKLYFKLTSNYVRKNI